MHARAWAIFIVISIIVSAAVILIIFFIWDRAQPLPPATATSIPTRAPVTEEIVSASTALPAPSPTSMEQLLYTVREGDTLGAIAQTHGVSVKDLVAANGLANPDVLSVGQTLIIPVDTLYTPAPVSPAEPPPEPSPTAATLLTLLPTLTPSGPPLVEIGQVLGSGNLMAEAVIVRNRGGMVSLEGWTLADAEGNIFTFPALTLFTAAQVRVHTAGGNSAPSDLYWGRANPAWSGGELITLRDASGNVVDTYIVP